MPVEDPVEPWSAQHGPRETGFPLLVREKFPLLVREKGVLGFAITDRFDHCGMSLLARGRATERGNVPSVQFPRRSGFAQPSVVVTQG